MINVISGPTAITEAFQTLSCSMRGMTMECADVVEDNADDEGFLLEVARRGIGGGGGGGGDIGWTMESTGMRRRWVTRRKREDVGAIRTAMPRLERTLGGQHVRKACTHIPISGTHQGPHLQSLKHNQMHLNVSLSLS